MANSIDAVFIYSQQNPQSVAALVRAVRPTEAHVERIAALEARCRRLQDELDATDGEHERSLRALQQEHLKFKSNMERRYVYFNFPNSRMGNSIDVVFCLQGAGSRGVRPRRERRRPGRP